MVIVSRIIDNIVKSVKTDNYAEAKRMFDAFVKKDIPVKMEWESVPANIAIEYHNWSNGKEITLAESTTRLQIQEQLVKSGIPSDKVATVMTMELKDIVNAVIGKNMAAFTAMKGIGDKTADKIIKALNGKVTFGAMIIGNNRKQFHQRVRVTLNPNWMVLGDDRPWIFDSVRKRWSNLEAYAAAISGDEHCIINVVSTIPELSAPVWDLAARERGEIKQDLWDEVCHKGLTLNGKRYVFIGHGTNAAKENSTLFCRAEYAEQVCKHFAHDVNPGWKITDAKYVAYMIGLQSVYAEDVGLPIEPEDFEIFDSLIQEIKDDVCQNHIDGTNTFIKGKMVKQNQFDGFSVFHVSAKMQNKMIQRLVDKGIDRMEAIRRVNHEIAILKGHTFRVAEAAFKGVVYTNFDIHSFLHDRGVHTLHGRDIDDIVVFSDTTVLKTAIGDGKAYVSKEAWANAVREGFVYKKLLCEHELKRKDIPYQVIQTAHKADRGTVEMLAEEQASELNAMHDIAEAKKCLTKEQRKLLDFIPEAANTRYFSDRMETGFYNTLDNAFSGKRIGQCYNALLAPDVIAFAEHIGGLEVKGFLEAGQVCCFKLAVGEIAFWRNPVLDTGSLRVLYNVKKVPEEYKKYFNFDTTMMMVNIKDTTITRVRGDYDGDKGSFSRNKTVIAMFKEAHQNFGDWLTDWDEIDGSKGVVTRETQLDYAATLCRESTLGQTCTGLNKLYAGKHLYKDGTVKHFEITYGEVSNYTTRANNQVDEGKHGKKSFKAMESAAKKASRDKKREPLQPGAKLYRDLHDAMAKALANGASREPLDKLTTAVGEQYGSLDIYNARLIALTDRKFHIDNLPEGKFDVTPLLYKDELGVRGMTGLCRKGEIYVEALGYRVDEGLVNSIFRRTVRDWEMVQAENPDDPERNVNEESFLAQCRINGLAEIKQFAEACGSTLEDAFDVVTRWVFMKAPTIYKNDGTEKGAIMDVLFDQVNRGYWVIFGGMLSDRIDQLMEESIDMDNIDVAI